MHELLIVAIGPDSAELLTLQAAHALETANKVLLRTGRHGVTGWLSEKQISFDTLDALYEGADDFDTLNEKAAEYIVSSLEETALCYAVPDPVTDTTVYTLKKRGVSMRILAGITQENTARAKALEAGFSPDGGICAVTAVDFATHRIDPALPLLVTELNSRVMASEIKLRLLDVYAPEMQVLLGDDVILLEALDRQEHYDHLSCVYVPASEMTGRVRYTFGDLLDVMARLRRPGDGCPWDIEQTHESLRQYVIEEAYETVDAIDQGDMARVADELGDVLLQVVFHAQVAKEHGEFDIGDITTAICHKMITRHAHIFGDIVCETPEDVLRSWEAIKKKEKGLKATTDVMRDVPGHLPALMRASKVQNKAKQVGFDWDSPQAAFAKVDEESREVLEDLAAGRDPEGEFGDLLFAVVNAARLSGVQPEVALGGATEKFIRRFERMEQAILADGKQMTGMTLAQMDVYWDAIKQAEHP